MSFSWQTSAAAAAAGRVPPSARRRARAHSLRLPPPELVGLVVVTALLNLWDLSRNGWANEYYAAAVRSMSHSWHDFLYASMDPSGVMTVDKPPLALWVQALSARVFGLSSLSILVPQALMGIATVVLVYDLVRRRFGRFGGAVAGLALALTPITVAMSRHNNPDALLTLCCVAALWCALRGLERGRTSWLVASGVCVGLAFETKMLVAMVVVPAIAVAWLWVRPAARGARHAVRQLLCGGAAMLVVGGAWPLLVELTPAADRPWVSGTSNNTILSLIFEYNGIGRVEGQAGGPAGGFGSGTFGGSAGPLRLLNSALGGQDGWLLGFALVGIAAVVVATRLRRSDPRSGWIVAVAGTFLTTAALFSFAGGIFHPYYVVLLAPFTAALVGACAALLADRAVPLRVFMPLAALAGVAVELVVHSRYPANLAWLTPVLIVLAAGAAAAILLPGGRRSRAAAVALLVGALLIAPAIWSVDTLGHATAGTFPAGGPASLTSFGGPPAAGGGRRLFAGPQPGGAFGGGGAPGGLLFGRPRVAGRGFGGGGFGSPPGGGGGGFAGGSLKSVVSYVEHHGGGPIAVESQSQAAAAILSSGADVAGVGGFSGRESAVSVAWLAGRVRAGAIRWVVVEGVHGSGATEGGPFAGSTVLFGSSRGGAPQLGGGFGGGRGGSFGRGLGGFPEETRIGSRVALEAAAKACRKVATGSTSGGTLYDCAGRAGAIEARAKESAA